MDSYMALTRSKYHKTRKKAATCSSSRTTLLGFVPWGFERWSTEPALCRSVAMGSFVDSATRSRALGRVRLVALLTTTPSQ